MKLGRAHCQLSGLGTSRRNYKSQIRCVAQKQVVRKIYAYNSVVGDVGHSGHDIDLAFSRWSGMVVDQTAHR